MPAVQTLADAVAAFQAGAKTGRPVELLFCWTHLRAVGIGYAMAVAAKAKAGYPGVACVTVLDAGEDAGMALSALRSGANRVLFSGPRETAIKLGQIAEALGVTLAAASGR